MIVSIYMSPMIKAYQFHDYPSAANILYEFNGFFLGFGFGIEGLPSPTNPACRDVMERSNSAVYYRRYYEKYAPLMSIELGKYQRDVLDYIKDERGMT